MTDGEREEMRELLREHSALTSRTPVQLGAVVAIVAAIFYLLQFITSYGRADVTALTERLTALDSRITRIEGEGTSHSNKELAAMQKSVDVEAAARAGSDNATKGALDDVTRRINEITEHLGRISVTWLPSIEQRLGEVREGRAADHAALEALAREHADLAAHVTALHSGQTKP